MQESKSLIKAERLKEKLEKQDFHYVMEEVFEPVTVKRAEATKKQKQLSERQIQAIGQQTQTIENQTRAIQQSSDNLNEIYKSQSNKEYKIMMKRLNVLFNLLQILLVQTKLILL